MHVSRHIVNIDTISHQRDEYIVSSNDRAINPDLERLYAKRAGAKTTEIKASHAPFLSHPKAVAKVIEEAAR